MSKLSTGHDCRFSALFRAVEKAIRLEKNRTSSVNSRIDEALFINNTQNKA